MDKRSRQEGAIGKAILYQDIPLLIAIIGISTSSDFGQRANKSLCRDDMWNQSKTAEIEDPETKKR